MSDHVPQPIAPQDPNPSAPKARSPLRPLLRVLVLCLLAWLVSRVLPLEDSLAWTEGATQQRIAGTIEGDWKADSVRFVPQDGETVVAPFPREDKAYVVERNAQVGASAVSWRPSLGRVLSGVRPRGLALAFACVVGSVLVTSARWWRLLVAVGCRTRWFDALRLTALGFFFNLVVPGLTGGDWVKAVLAARENPSARTAAAVSVFVDRIIGLVTLIGLGSAAAFLAGPKFAFLRAPLCAALAAAALGATLYFHRGLRRALGVEGLLARLSRSRLGRVFAQIDAAVLLYSRRPGDVLWAFACSVVNHAFVVATFVVLARTFGERALRLVEYVVIISIGNTASAVPIAPGGWGVGEYVFGSLFEQFGASSSLGIAVSVTYRLLLLSSGLLGGLFLLLPGARSEWRAAQQVAEPARGG